MIDYRSFGLFVLFSLAPTALGQIQIPPFRGGAAAASGGIGDMFIDTSSDSGLTVESITRNGSGEIVSQIKKSLGIGDETPAPGAPAPGTPGTPATPAPGTPATPAPGTPATPAPGTPATPAPGTPATPAPGTPATPAPGTPATPAPGTPATPAPAGGTTFKFINGRSVYTRRFFATGVVTGACVNIDEFCNEVEDGDPSAFVSCFAARKAVSTIQGGYSFEGRLRAAGGSSGVISDIDLTADATTAALALSFSNSEASVGTATTVDVGALAVSGSELSRAAALARGNSTSKAVSVAYASALGESGSVSYSGTQMVVRADRISLFEGFVTSAAQAFALSDTESESLAASAASAYTEAVTAARTAALNKEVSFAAEAYSGAEARAGAFGQSVASSVASIGISFTFATKIMGGGSVGVDIEFGRGISAKLSCA